MRANILCYVLYIYVDLDTSTTARNSDPPEDDEQLSLDPLVDDSQAEDDEDAEEEPVEEPTAAEIVEAGASLIAIPQSQSISVQWMKLKSDLSSSLYRTAASAIWGQIKAHAAPPPQLDTFALFVARC